MTEESLKVACNACQVGLEGPTEPSPQDIFTCPSCGLAEKYDTIAGEIGEWVEDMGGHTVQEEIASIIRGNKVLKFEPSKLPKRTHRFVLLKDA